MTEQNGENQTYDSRVDTLAHSHRVGQLMAPVIADLAGRSVTHDRSKLSPPEVAMFDEYSPKLSVTPYGSNEYKAHLAAMGPALAHHYAHNPHHPEYYPNGINGMNLADLIEMLADWRASTERGPNGDLYQSLIIQRERFSMSDQLTQILFNTAVHCKWMTPPPCNAPGKMAGHVCNVPLDGPGWHWGPHADGRWDGGASEWWTDTGCVARVGHGAWATPAADPAPVAHAWTPHGHQCCPSAPLDRTARPQSIARCGGPGLCKQCGNAAHHIHNGSMQTAGWTPAAS